MKYLLNEIKLKELFSNKIQSLINSISKEIELKNKDLLEKYKTNITSDDWEKIKKGETSPEIQDKVEQLNRIGQAIESGEIDLKVVDLDFLKPFFIFTDKELQSLLTDGKEEKFI